MATGSSYGLALKELRLSLGLSQRALGHLLGLKEQASVSSRERSRVDPFKYKEVVSGLMVVTYSVPDSIWTVVPSAEFYKTLQTYLKSIGTKQYEEVKARVLGRTANESHNKLEVIDHSTRVTSVSTPITKELVKYPLSKSRQVELHIHNEARAKSGLEPLKVYRRSCRKCHKTFESTSVDLFCSTSCKGPFEETTLQGLPCI